MVWPIGISLMVLIGKKNICSFQIGSSKQSTVVIWDRHICINSNPQQHDKGHKGSFLGWNSASPCLSLPLLRFFVSCFFPLSYSLYAINVPYDYLEVNDSLHSTLSLFPPNWLSRCLCWLPKRYVGKFSGLRGLCL